jgi:adenosylhomocysteine nucleosidase
LLVFVAAERRELEGLLRHVEGAAKPDWPVDFARIGRLNGREVALVANGPGPKLAGDAVDAVGKREALISIGFCGGLVPALGVCDIVAATEVLGSGPARLPVTSRAFKSGPLLSIDRVISSSAEKTDLGKSGASAVEMEAAAVAARAHRWNIPFYAVRVVTDTCAETFPLDFNHMRHAEGRFSRGRILRAALRRPFAVIPQLIQLNQTTKRASRALGDFLADSRF